MYDGNNNDARRRPLTRPIVDTIDDDDDDESQGKCFKCKNASQKSFMCLLIAILLCTSVTFAALWRLEVGKVAQTMDNRDEVPDVRRALIDLYFSTNSNRTWSGCGETACNEARCEGKVRWVSQEHYCTWKCVSCDANQVVTGLFLAHNRMSGTIPASLTWISTLRQLDVSENAHLAGTLPASLGGNAALQALAFNNTQISGTLPAALSRAENLRSVAAVGARLSGFIPPMASLHSLMLQGQRGPRLSGTLPATDWPLEAFYLGHNRLSGTLPSSISTPIVDLDANAFTGGLPSTYTDAVRVLKISCGSPPSATGGQVSGGGGCLSGTLPTGLGTASNLEWLELENNRLSGSLPAAVFSGLRSLTTLYLRGNDLSGAVPDGLPTCAAPSCACDLSGNCFDSDKVPAACEGSTPGQQPSCEGPTPAPTPAPTPPVDPVTPTPTPTHPDGPSKPTPMPTPHPSKPTPNPSKPTPTPNSIPADDY